MDNTPLHTPDFTAPDMTQPTLQDVDLATPGFTQPDPSRPDTLIQSPPWPADLMRLPINRPDPASPDLMEPEIPASLSIPDSSTHVMPEPRYELEVEMTQRPGEMDPQARETLLDGADREELPQDIGYPQLYTAQDEMSTRKRHLGMLELGLERSERAEQ